MEKQVKWGKWFALGLGGLIGLSHIGMIGSLSNRQSKLPSINLPVGPYTSYEAEVGHEGYKISYKANDPKIMRVERDIKKKGGFLGLANNIEKVTEQYTMVRYTINQPQQQSHQTEESPKHVSKQSEVQKEQEDSWVPVLVLLLLLLSLIFPLLVGLLLVG